MVGHWNSWFNALLYLTDKNRYPLQMVLRRLVVQEDMGAMYSDSIAAIFATSFGMHTKNAQMAAVVLAMAPILVVYPFIQKHFAKGVMIGAIQGMITRAQAAFHKIMHGGDRSYEKGNATAPYPRTARLRRGAGR